jgi:glucokinase
LYRGHNGSHPEVGHQAIPCHLKSSREIICECGSSGCLEAVVSGNAIRRLYEKPAEKLTEDEWREVAANLGHGLRNCAVFYAPEIIILGGGVALGRGERLIKDAVNGMTENLSIISMPTVKLSALGYDSALYGAVALGMGYGQ